MTNSNTYKKGEEEEVLKYNVSHQQMGHHMIF